MSSSNQDDVQSSPSSHEQVDTTSPQRSNTNNNVPPFSSYTEVSEPSEDDEDEAVFVDSSSNTASPKRIAPTAASLASAASSSAVQYDPHDHTTAAPPSTTKTVQRVWVLPRALLPADHITPLLNDTDACDTPAVLQEPMQRAAVENAESTRTSTQSTAAAAGGGLGNASSYSAYQQHNTDFGSSESASVHSDGRMSAGAAAVATNRSFPLAAYPVRIPHPRHAQPTLYLIKPASTTTTTTTTEETSFGPSSLLFELQAQAPPNGFAQSWFVGETVLPSAPHKGEMIVVTPVDLTYFALSAFFADAAVYERLSRTFMSAGDLYRTGDTRTGAAAAAAAAGATPALAGQETTAEVGQEGESSAYVSVFGGVGGCDDEGGSQASSSSHSSPFAYNFGNSSSTTDTLRRGATSSLSATGNENRFDAPSLTRSGTSADPSRGGLEKGWQGWAHASAHHPLLFHACYDALQSEAVLRRCCEVREIGGVAHVHANSDNNCPTADRPDCYYKPSEEVALRFLKAKIEELRQSAVLRELLQLPAVSSSVNTIDASTPPSTTSHSMSAEVPMSIAFGMVAEYVPERLHAPLAALCGIADASPQSSPSAAGVKRDRDGEQPQQQQQQRARVDPANSSSSLAGIAGMEKKSSAETQSSTGPKSASVKRLEKAGRPKGTPTLFSMFAKKKKDGE